MGRRSRLPLGLVVAAALSLCASAAGKGTINGSPAAGGVALKGSPYRFLTITPKVPHPVTVVERIARRGGRVSRWWYLPGRFSVTAPTYDLTGAGLSADERILVLTRFDEDVPSRRTRLAIVETGPHLRHPGEDRRGAISYANLKGDYGVFAVSPDGGTAYLTHLLPGGPPQRVRFTLRALDTASGRLLPRFSIPGNGEILSGLPATREPDRAGRTVYTLYYDFEGRRTSLLVLDTVAPSLRRVELPQLRGRRDPMLLRLRLADNGRQLTVATRSRNGQDRSLTPLLRVDTRTLAIRRIPAQANILDWARTPRRPGNLLGRRALIGRSTLGRRIGMYQLGDPAIADSLLVFGCIHGDECAGSGSSPIAFGCPDPYADILVVPNLDPDGSALGTRLNGRGVDLNRNFAAAWRPLGERGDPEYSGPRPFSEPETRLAARIVRAARPRVTVWFHQHRGDSAYVRAWGQSIAAGRRFAALAGVPFRPLPWSAGTGPHWQNLHFPGTSSFVVELPAGPLASGVEHRIGRALGLLGREVGEDGDVARKG